MYMIKEEGIKAWRDYNKLQFIQCACRFTENCSTCGGGRKSKRDEMKDCLLYTSKTIIPRNIRLAEAPSYGMPINMYDTKSTGAESYRMLADEVIDK